MGSDNIEERAQIIAARAQRLLAGEETQWEGYCHPGCPKCAIEFAREQLDEERGWDATEESCATSEAAMCRALTFSRGRASTSGAVLVGETFTVDRNDVRQLGWEQESPRSGQRSLVEGALPQYRCLVHAMHELGVDRSFRPVMGAAA